ncbi:hypothetical protein, partial [Spongiactinospora sp. TRM90649]|uniref:hypothetical protein n=1 Tax=Spongiactinospora sp. TRM90649 TaxID=3031114 RepID=UPI0023F904E3
MGDPIGTEEQPQNLIDPNLSLTFSAQSIAALSRNDDFMDLFAVGTDGHVWNARWNGNPWQACQRVGSGMFGQGTPIAALSRHEDFMDLFAVGTDGKVHAAWWNGNPWRE